MTPEEIASRFGDSVERLRLAAGISKAELARRVQTHPSNVGRIIQGAHSPTAKTLSDYANALGVDVCELLCTPKRKKS